MSLIEVPQLIPTRDLHYKTGDKTNCIGDPTKTSGCLYFIFWPTWYNPIPSSFDLNFSSVNF